MEPLNRTVEDLPPALPDSPDPILWVALGALAATAGVYQYFSAGRGPLSLGLVTLGTVCVIKGMRERARLQTES